MDTAHCDGNRCRVLVTDCQVLNKGNRCLAKFSEDGCWYRAVVMDKSQNFGTVKFIDYGHEQVTLLSSLKSMPEELATIDPLCHEFILDVDVDGDPDQGNRTKEVAERLKSEYSYHEIMVELRNLSDSCFVAKSSEIRQSLIAWGFIAESSALKSRQVLLSPQFSVHQKLHVSVNNVLSDSSFYCHTLAMEKTLNQLLDDLYDSCTGPKAEPLTRPSIGDHCCSMCSDGNWYRSCVVDIDANDAVVRLVDYGEISRCRLSSLMLLPAKYASLPAQGIHCILSADRRPQEKVKILRGLIERPVTIEFVNTNLKPFPVRLYYRGELVGVTAPSDSINGLKPIIEESDEKPSKEFESKTRQSGHSLEVPLNCETPIRITYVENPSNIWIQLIDYQAKLIKLTGTLNVLCNTPGHDVQLTNVKAGQVCCVKSQRTHHWCRGKVNFVCNNSVEVKFIDFGFTEVTHSSNIRTLRDEFSQLPSFAICCKLDNVTPVSGKWCSASTKYLNEFVAKSGLTAKFVPAVDDVYVVEIIVLAQYGRIILNNEMVEKGFARFSSNLNAVTLGDSRLETCSSSILPSSKRYYSHAGVSSVGAQVLVSVCADPTPQEFWVLPCNAQLERTFNQLTKEMHCYHDSTLMRFDELYSGMPCVYVTKNEVLRAAVVSFENPTFPAVLFVDVGRKRRVPITCLRPIADEHIYFIHPLAIRCTMCGIIEPMNKLWSPAAIRQFLRFCLDNNRNIHCTIHACVTDGTSEMAMVRVSSPFKDIADILVQTGNCQYVRPFGKLFAPFSLKSFIHSRLTGIGKEERFYVTHAERADLFYCQLNGNFAVIDGFMDSIQEYCNSHKASRATIQELAHAPLCFVKYDDDKWYRAHFVSMVSKKNYIVVFLVDYGNLVNVLLQNVVVFDQKSALAEIPMQALPCCLSEIVSEVSDYATSARILSKLKTLILHKEFFGLVTGSTNGKLHIDLYTDELQKKRINSDFTEDINPLAVLPPIMPTSTDKDTLLKGQYKDISSTLESKSCHTVTVTYVKDPFDFFVLFESHEEMFEACCNEVDGRYTAMRCQDYCVTSLNKGDIICAKQPSTLRWCRGVVIDIESCKESKVLVEFVDYGCKEIVSVTDSVKKLSVDLRQWPKLAIHCQLNNVQPVGEDWSAASRDQFASLCQFPQCRLRFNTYIEAKNIWTVDMKVEGKSVARMLVEKNHAVYVVSPPNYAGLSDECIGAKKKECLRPEQALVKTEKTVVVKAATSEQRVKTEKNNYFGVNVVSKVYMSHVEPTGTVYLQLVDMENALETMMDKINQSTAKCKSIDAPDMSFSYLSRYEEDGRLYRVNILALHHDGKIDIVYSDYGNSASVVASQLFVLPKEFSELPEQATKCQVSCPPKIELPKVVAKLEELAIDEEVSITACFLKSSAFEVELQISKECDGSTTKFVDLFEQNFKDTTGSLLKLEYQKRGVETRTKLKVYVSQVDSPSQVWIQLSSGTTCLDTLMADIEEFCADCQTLKKPESLVPGMPCLAKYEVDDGWYRGEIVKLFKSEAVILFVDYGNKETVKIENILTIDKKFFAIPQQAIKCRLHNVCNMEAWTPSDIAKFVDRVSDVELVAYFHRCAENPEIYDVDLVYPCGKSLNKEWNETLPSCSDIINAGELTKDPNEMNETAISATNHVVMDRGDHVIVDNVMGAPISELDFNSSPIGKNPSHSTSSDSDISISIGCIEDGYISHCEHPGLFYVQLTRLTSTLDEIAEEVSIVYETKPSQSVSIDIGDLCVAKCTDSGLWYRGKCVAKDDGGSFSVYFIDYGNTSLVSSADILEITPKLSAFPNLAIACKLHELELVGDSWSNATDSFLNLTLDQEMKVKFVELRDGLWSVKLALSEDDIGECLLGRHGDIVAQNITVNKMIYETTPAFGIMVESGSILCIKVVNVDGPNERFDAIQLSTPKSKFEKTITNCLHEKNDQCSVSLRNLEVYHYYLICLQQRWTCVKILDVTGESASAVDLLEGELVTIDIHSKIIQCPADVACIGDNILLSCILPSDRVAENLMGDVVVAQFRSKDSGNWTVDILSIYPFEESKKHKTNEISNNDDGIVNWLGERPELTQWVAEHLTDLTQFFVIGDTLFEDCPKYIKCLYQNLLNVKSIMLAAKSIEEVENSQETLKRLSCDTLGKHEYPAKKMRLEGCKDDWTGAILSKFAIGDNFEAVICSIVHPWKIFLRPYLLVSELTPYNHADVNVDDRGKEIIQSKYCLVQVTDTLANIDHWVRGKFIAAKDDSFLFTDMDSGLNVEGTMENIIPVGKSLLSWPLFCMECFLTGIKPSHRATSWDVTPTNELNDIFHSLNVTDKVEVTIVTIFTSESGEKTFGVDINVNKESLSKRLIAMEIACPADVDKENIGNELATTSDDLNRGLCRKPLKELDICNMPNHSPLPITPTSTGKDLPIIDLLAVPWKVVRSSHQVSNSERLSDSVFVSETDGSVGWNSNNPCGRRQMSFKIYCSHVESATDKNIVDNCMSLLSEMPEGEADDRIEPCESADIMQQSDNNAIPILHNTDRRVEIATTNGIIPSTPQGTICSEDEKEVDEFAWELVETVLYDLTITENQLSGDESNDGEVNAAPASPQFTEDQEDGVGFLHQDREESTDGSHTMIDETYDASRSNTLPILPGDGNLSCESIKSLGFSSQQQAEVELEEAVRQLNLKQPNNTTPSLSANNEVDCEQLAVAVNNLDLQDDGCNGNALGASSPSQTIDELSDLAGSMQLTTTDQVQEKQDSTIGCSRNIMHQEGSNNEDYNTGSKECCDYDDGKQFTGKAAAAIPCEPAGHLLLHVDSCTIESKNSEQYYSAESCFASNNLDHYDKESHVGGSHYDSATDTEFPSDVSEDIKHVSDADVESNSDLPENGLGTPADIQAGETQLNLVSSQEIESDVEERAFPQLIVTPADVCCFVESPDECGKSTAIAFQEDIILSDVPDFSENNCLTSHCNQIIGICCLPPLQIDIGDVYGVSFLRIGIDPGTMLLQFDTGSDTSDWQKAMIQANSADSTSKLKPCKYFESDMMCLVRSANSSLERGRVIRYMDDMYVVELIDNGGIVEVKEAMLHQLPEDLCMYPRQSIECQIHGIKIDVDEAASRRKWTAVVRPYLDGLLKGRLLKAEIVALGQKHEKVISVKLNFQEEDEAVVDVSGLLVNTGLALLVGHDEIEDDGQWTTIDDSSYDELVKGSDTSAILHSSNADLSIIEEAFEEELPEIPPEKSHVKSQIVESDLTGVAKSLYASVLAGALVVTRFGGNDVTGQL